MKSKKLNTIMFMLVIVFTIVAVGVTGYNLVNKDGEVKVHSLIQKFDGLQKMYDGSDIIVTVEVNKVNEPIVVDRRDYLIIPDDLTKDDFMPQFSKFVVSEVKVDKVLKGNIGDQSSIEIIQETTMENQKNEELEQVKVLEEKVKYVMFLKYYNPDTEQAIKDFKSPKYMVVGLYQGQFEVEDNKVLLNDEQKYILNYKSRGLFSPDMTLEGLEEKIQECNPTN